MLGADVFFSLLKTESLCLCLLQNKHHVAMSQKMRNFMYTLLCTSITESLDVEEDVHGSWVDLNTPHVELGEENQIERFVSEMLSKEGAGLKINIHKYCL